MKSDLRKTLDRQAAWQRARAGESWAEKLRTAVVLRRAMLAIRKAPLASPTAEAHSRK